MCRHATEGSMSHIVEIKPDDWALTYILDDNKNPVPARALEWARWFTISRDKRRVASDDIGTTFISTVFVGIDLSHGDADAPVLFETMVFHDGSWLEDTSYGIKQYSTWAEAEEGHRQTLEEIKTR